MRCITMLILAAAFFMWGFCYSADAQADTLYTHLSGSVSGICYDDRNENKQKDDDETGIAGVTLSLKRFLLSPVIRQFETETTETDESGFYVFSDLARGIYIIEEADPEEYISTTSNRILFYLGSLQKNRVIDFGDFWTGIPVQPVPAVSISADPQSIVAGESSVLTWISENAVIVSIDQGIGEVETEGSQEVFPEETTTYTITAEGEHDIAQDSVTVTVIQPLPPPAAEPTVTITADPLAAESGQSIRLTWESSNAKSAGIKKIINNKSESIGPVPLSGSLADQVFQTTAYIITVIGDGGTATANVTVEVETSSKGGGGSSGGSDSGDDGQNDDDDDDNDDDDIVLIGLISFSAIGLNGNVIIKWQTESEIDTAGFNIYRADEEQGEFIQINEALIAAQGSPAEGAQYEFIDAAVENRQTYYYMLEDVDVYGVSTMHGPVSATPSLIYGE